MSDSQVESSKALSLARKYDDQGDLSSAIKWCKKSIAIHSTPEAAALLSRLETKGVNGASSSKASGAAAGSSSSSSAGVKSRASAGASTATPPKPDRAFTKEQAAIVTKIKGAGGDFYKVLGVEKTVEDGGIKKAYRKVRDQRSETLEGSEGRC